MTMTDGNGRFISIVTLRRALAAWEENEDAAAKRSEKKSTLGSEAKIERILTNENRDWPSPAKPARVKRSTDTWYVSFEPKDETRQRARLTESFLTSRKLRNLRKQSFPKV